MDHRLPSKAERSAAFKALLAPQAAPGDAPVYQAGTKAQKKTFLIVCEGANTEPAYFKSFPVSAEVVRTVDGAGVRKSVVLKAKQEAVRPKNEGREVWCVFDFDLDGANSEQKKEFNEAVEDATREGYQAAYSNDAFELWLVLHYQTCESALHRTGYYEILTRVWNLPHSYERMGKGAGFSAGIYDRIQDDIKEGKASQELAIRRAEQLYETHRHRPYADQCPCTTVYRLVRELENQKDTD